MPHWSGFVMGKDRNKASRVCLRSTPPVWYNGPAMSTPRLPDQVQALILSHGLHGLPQEPIPMIRTTESTLVARVPLVPEATSEKVAVHVHILQDDELLQT